MGISAAAINGDTYNDKIHKARREYISDGFLLILHAGN
jgi:hypothetical protein